MTQEEIAQERGKIAKIAEAARQFLNAWDEFGDPSCVGEYLDALIDAIDATGD